MARKKMTWQFDTRREAKSFITKKGGAWKIEKLNIFGVSWFNVGRRK